MKQLRYIMIGGFLGAGKTTALLQLGSYLKERGLRAGLITNDQSIDLVDTARARAAGQSVAEVTGGCFCCKFDHLMQAAQGLADREQLDAIIAEPVGSCTDVRATVGYPLRQLYGDRFTVAPLSVLVDPIRCAQAIGLQPGGGFTEKVTYIYRKQLEEADLIVVNKIHSINEGVRSRLVEALRDKYPQARVLEVSCRTGEGVAAWFDLLLNEDISTPPAMEVDYDIYADGEALLGWLNARASFTLAQAVAGNKLMLDLLQNLRTELADADIEIAHAKVSVETDNPSDFGSVSLTSTVGEPAITWTSENVLSQGQLTLNLRAEADPDLLRDKAIRLLNAIPGISLCMEEMAAFRPGRPTPTHRFTTADS